MPDEVRTAVIGYGYWGPNLARNLHAVRGARLVAVADALPDRLSEAENLFPGLRSYTDYREVLADPSIEAVAIATPVRTHAVLAREALQNGKHVLVEKPLALSSAECLELRLLSERMGRVLMVGHTFEYNPAVWKIKELMSEGAIGQTYYIYSTRVNLGRVQRDVNALWSIAPHDISILLYLLGNLPTSVSARGATFLTDGIEDVVFLTLNFPGNVLAHVHVSWLDPSKVRRMTIVGSNKMIVYDDVDSESKIKIYDKGVYRKGDPSFGEYQVKVHSGDIFIPKINMTEPLANECAHFIECVHTRATPRSNAENGWRVVRVLEAAQESLSKHGASVAIP